jgi:hypothetical protein
VGWEGRGDEGRELEEGEGDYKDDMMGHLVATTEVSYSKGIESIVFHQLIFHTAVQRYGSRSKIRGGQSR